MGILQQPSANDHDDSCVLFNDNRVFFSLVNQ